MPGVGFFAAQDIPRAQLEVLKYDWLAPGGPAPDDFERAVRERPSNGVSQVPEEPPRLSEAGAAYPSPSLRNTIHWYCCQDRMRIEA